MNFFTIKPIAIGGKKYPWASGIGPLEAMPFLDWMPAELRAGRNEFWRLNPRPPGMMIDPGGCQWSDLIGCGDSFLRFFASEKIVVDLAEAGIEVFRATEMPIAKIDAKKLKAITPPRYYVLEASPGIQVDWKKMGVPTDSENKAIMRPNPTPWPPPRWIVDPATWRGADLFSFSNWQTQLTLVVTDRVVKLARERDWTNIDFVPLHIEG
jgi:hypothetical protein